MLASMNSIEVCIVALMAILVSALGFVIARIVAKTTKDKRLFKDYKERMREICKTTEAFIAEIENCSSKDSFFKEKISFLFMQAWEAAMGIFDWFKLYELLSKDFGERLLTTYILSSNRELKSTNFNRIFFRTIEQYLSLFLETHSTKDKLTKIYDEIIKIGFDGTHRGMALRQELEKEIYSKSTNFNDALLCLERRFYIGLIRPGIIFTFVTSVEQFNLATKALWKNYPNFHKSDGFAESFYADYCDCVRKLLARKTQDEKMEILAKMYAPLCEERIYHIKEIYASTIDNKTEASAKLIISLLNLLEKWYAETKEERILPICEVYVHRLCNLKNAEILAAKNFLQQAKVQEKYNSFILGFYVGKPEEKKPAENSENK